MNSLTVDLNCDMGESFGSYVIGNDEALLQYVSSANIACGLHAGDPAVMHKTVKLALANGVAIGAHPGLPDLAGFGRREMVISPAEAYDLLLYQLGALGAFTQAQGAKLQHVKPHGALYNMAAVNAALAEAIAEAVYQFNSSLVLFGLSGSELVKAGEKRGLQVAREVFADRSYQADGTLTPRREANALITDPAIAAQQVLRMVKEGKVKTQQDKDIEIQADTVCIHGDGPYALTFAQHIHQLLMQEGIKIQAKSITS